MKRVVRYFCAVAGQKQSQTTRVLVLTASTGGGHDMQARAFQTWAEIYPEFGLRAQLHRPLEDSHGLYRFGVELYNRIQRTAPALHHLYYTFLEVVPVVRGARPLGAGRYRAVLETVRPDVILSVHDSLNHGFFEHARTVLPDVRCVTYCMELAGGYGFSRHWVNPAADLFIGCVPEICDAAVKHGMPAEKVRLGGFLLRPEFYERPLGDAARAAFIRERLQLDPNDFILLLSASGHGVNNHVAFLEALETGTQVVVLCGRSAEAAESVREWTEANPAARVRVMPPDTNVARLMRCASALVARGSGTVASEAIVSGCPLLLNGLGGVMPQERITVKYCRRHGLGQLVRRPAELARHVAVWRQHTELPALMREAMERVRPAAHPREILQAVRSRSTGAGDIPVIEAVRAARPAAPVVPEKILRPPAPAVDAPH